MNVYSWFGRTKKGSTSSTTTTTITINNEINEEQFYGITDEVINFIKTFTLELFKNFSLQDEQGDIESGESMVQKDLTHWQEKHALLVLNKVKELSQLRFRLCPRYLKERQFWRIYFTLVKNHVGKYELHAIRLEKLKQIALENKKDSDGSAYEVEMLETKKPTNSESATLLE